MKNKCSKRKSLQRKLLFTIFAILALSSFFTVAVITYILPLTSSIYDASFDSDVKADVVGVFRVYSFMSMGFAFMLSTILISISVNKVLKPIRALTDGTNKVAHGDFSTQLPVKGNRQDELSILTDSFNKMARELSLINMLNNDFANNVSHEFKTPISSIQGFATVLLGTNLNGQQKEYAEIIAFESARLTRLISNILKLTKIESQAIVTDKEDFYIDEQIRHSFILLQSEAQKKNIEIDLDLDKIKYWGNPELVGQIWHNLLSNAIKFTDEHGRITIKCYKDNFSAMVSVEDSGVGMDYATIKHIYDKFYQSDTSHSGEGNGLGLALVNRIVSLCKGEIDVKSEPGKGTIFTVTLPPERNEE